MIGPVRRSLQRIRYYSATREQSCWDRALDHALVLAFVLALPAAWLSNVLVVRLVTVESLDGRLEYTEQREMIAAGLGGDMPERWTASRPAGSITLHVVDQIRGLPWASTVRKMPLRADVDLFDEPDVRRNVLLHADRADVAGAVAAQLEHVGRFDLLDRVDRPSRATAKPVRWLANASVWCVGLYVVGVILIQSARVLSFLRLQRRVHRQRASMAEGRCANCGYDLRGLKFSTRCPECGELVY